jgi:hypothetical protein
MKNLFATLNTNGFRMAALAVALFTLGTVLSYAAPVQTVTLTVVNNSTREIRHLYLSPAENDNWGPDQLNESAINPGASRTLNVTWEQPTVKLVGEDQDGCFLTTIANATSNIEWTITAETTRNCGN